MIYDDQKEVEKALLNGVRTNVRVYHRSTGASRGFAEAAAGQYQSAVQALGRLNDELERRRARIKILEKQVAGKPLSAAERQWMAAQP